MAKPQKQTESRNSPQQSLTHYINRKRLLEEKVRRLRKEGFDVAQRRSPAQMAAGDAATRRDSLIARFGSSEDVPANRKGELKAFDEVINTNRETIIKARNREQQISREIAEAREELETLSYTAGYQDVLDFQAKVADAEQQIEDLRAAIAEQKETISDAEDALPTPGDLKQQRDTLRAEIAMGAEKAGELAAVEQAIEEEATAIDQARTEAEKAVSSARQTLAGLGRKVTEAEAALAALRAQAPDLILEFLLGQAEDAYRKYEQAAHTVGKQFGQLRAIDTLIRRHAPEPYKNTLMGLTVTIKVPGVSITPHQVAGTPPTLPDMLVDGNDIHASAVLGPELERFRSHGVTIL
jgi:chromosome segregation ATPase